jgi:hypothetical protein
MAPSSVEINPYAQKVTVKVITIPKNLPQEQHPDTVAYLAKKVTENKFNKFCVDCMKNKTSYYVMNFGIFVCESCAFQHYKWFP